jgi:hypothetical protein
MKTSLLRLLLVLVGFAAGEWFATAYLQRPLRVECEGPKPGVVFKDPGAAGSLVDDAACELSWTICWRRT